MADAFFENIIKPNLDQLSGDQGPDYGDLGRRTSSPVNFEDVFGDLTEFSDDTFPSQSLGGIELEDGESAIYENAAATSGLDVLAFYKSFRFIDQPPFRGTWGIYIIARGAVALAHQLGLEIEENDPYGREPTVGECLDLATDLLIRHEEYHFSVDLWALQREMLPIDERLKRYERYFIEKSMPSLFDEDVEESLANNYAYEGLRGRKLSNGRTAGAAIRAVLELGPGPYADFKLDAERRQLMEAALAVGVSNGRAPFLSSAAYLLLHGTGPQAIAGGTLRPARRDHPVMGAKNCPRHFVRSSRYSSLLAPFQSPSRSEGADFVTRYLDGRLEKQTDHAFFRIDNGEQVKFPNPHEKDLKPWEFKNLLGKAGMNVAEYGRERQRTKVWAKGCPRSPVKPARG
jgi:hypothetical protein